VPADELERARAVFAAWSGGEIEPMLEVWAADCELHSKVAGVVEGQGGVFRGHEGIRAYSRELAEALGHLVFELAEMRRRGRLTLMIGHTAGRGRASGVELDVPIFWLSEQNDEGKNIWAQAFGDLDEALVVAARREPSD
jgi:ketosteroid isomerase-like protein